jgi:hypothetical protein
LGQTVKAGSVLGELGLCAQRRVDDRRRQLEWTQRLEFLPQFCVLARVPSAVQNFKFEDWRAVKTPVLECLQPFVADGLVAATLKGGVVDDQIPAAEGPS